MNDPEYDPKWEKYNPSPIRTFIYGIVFMIVVIAIGVFGRCL
jgi:hypothetical protein